jgi:hypothetical protein
VFVGTIFKNGVRRKAMVAQKFVLPVFDAMMESSGECNVQLTHAVVRVTIVLHKTSQKSRNNSYRNAFCDIRTHNVSPKYTNNMMYAI